MYKANETADYIANTLQTPAQHMFLRKKAHEISASWQTQKLRKAQAIDDHDKAEHQIQAKLVRDKKTREKVSMLRSVEPILAPEDITESLTVAQLDLQIDWHKQYDKTIAKSRYKGKVAKVAALKEIVLKFHTSGRRIEDVIASPGLEGGLEAMNEDESEEE